MDSAIVYKQNSLYSVNVHDKIQSSGEDSIAFGVEDTMIGELFIEFTFTPVSDHGSEVVVQLPSLLRACYG